MTENSAFLQRAASLLWRGEREMSTVLARVEGRCGELVLRRDGEHFEVIANGVFLMDTRGGGRSERLLVKAAVERMAAPRGHVLIGGLGVGFSLDEAVQHDRVARVTVVEREPAVIDWARGPLAPFNGHALGDPRVCCVEADLLEHLRDGGTTYDAICLDIDNGPDWIVTEGNAGLYTDAGLTAVTSRLSEGGVLGVWSATASPGFAGRLRKRFDEVEVLTVPVPRGEPDTVFVARQQYACPV
jgi:spermidine synthase